MNSIALFIVFLSACTVIHSAPQYGGVFGEKNIAGSIFISQTTTPGKKSETSSLVAQTSSTVWLPSTLMLTGNGDAAVIHKDIIIPVLDCETSNTNCTGDICLKRLLIIRTVLLQRLNETAFQIELKEADKNADISTSITQLKFNLLTLRERWTRIEKINLKIQELMTNEEHLAAEVEITENLKDRINKMIFDAEQFIEKNSKTTEKQPSVNPELLRLNNSRSILVESMKGLLIEVEAVMSVANQSEKAKDIVNTRLEQDIWLQIVELSKSIVSLELSSIEEEVEFKYQEDLMRMRAKIHYKAKMRRCESPFETYFPAKKRCIKFESNDLEGACLDNQIVIDGPNNRGLCVCKDSDSTIMNRQDHQCYEQFTQGPCEEEDQWWVLNDALDAGVCEVKPKDCPSDGEHVYWSPPPTDDSTVPHKQCDKLGERGPCPEGSTVKQLELLVKCDERILQAVFSTAPITRIKKSCPKKSSKCV